VDFDVVVLGAGAAGMMCAATAGARGRRVALVEHSARLAEKIRISGGGRCNFTHLGSGPHAFLSRNPDFCRSALARFGPRDFLALVEKHAIAWREKSPGQLFCAGSSQQIIDLLVRECDAAGVRWLRPCRVEGVALAAPGAAHRFEVACSHGRLRARSLVVATGGLSVPKTGASALGYELAARFGLGVVTPRPALVPLALDAPARERFGELSGTLGFAKAEVTLGGVDTRELSSQTLEARRVPGLHFVGEVVDVTGWLGGHNFQWAWASGAAAGSAV